VGSQSTDGMPRHGYLRWQSGSIARYCIALMDRVTRVANVGLTPIGNFFCHRHTSRISSTSGDQAKYSATQSPEIEEKTRMPLSAFWILCLA
jgi:hypothetical protein